MRMFKRAAVAAAVVTALVGADASRIGQDLLGKLGEPQNYRSRRISSHDRAGGNRDSLVIEPGHTAVLAEIEGPAAIHHMWMTAAAEPFYGRKLILRIYWDGEEAPSVEAPLGDFFGVGHGLNRNLKSLPISNSSEGRARNCFWYMPFRWSCRVTLTNEGSRAVNAFYYYINYREIPDLAHDAPYFHAQYRQEMPPEKGRNYLILDAVGSGHYAGCVFSVLQRSMGWWGEGDDMIFIDGESEPSLHGTGSEDYFGGAWGMSEDESLFYGCPLQEEDFQAGSKASVYRFHIADPIPFRKSIRVTLEHGHANDRFDFLSSVAFWYQTEPHNPYPPLPPVDRRLPFAMEIPTGFAVPDWTQEDGDATIFTDTSTGIRVSGPELRYALTSFYSPRGGRYPMIATENAVEGTAIDVAFPIEIAEAYDLDLYLLKGPRAGNLKILHVRRDAETGEEETTEPAAFSGYATDSELEKVSLKSRILEEGMNSLRFVVAGKNPRSRAFDIGFLGLARTPSNRRFIMDWNLVAPFEAPDMDTLTVAFPPEQDASTDGRYRGKSGTEIRWRAVRAERGGYVRLSELVEPNENVVAYGLVWVRSPDERTAHVLLGSDDGVRLWINDELVHTNPVYRAAEPDQDHVAVKLKEGWNKVLIKVLQGGGEWGYYLRFADPKGELVWSLTPKR
jgi:hypothetical protein